MGVAGLAGDPHGWTLIGYFLAGALEGAVLEGAVLEGAALLVALDEVSVLFLACFLCFFTFVPGAAGEVVGSAGALDFGAAGVWVWANERAAAIAVANIKAVMRFIVLSSPGAFPFALAIKDVTAN